jgi:hypothetical protein
MDCVPALYIASKKRKNIQKNDFWDLYPGLNCVKMVPKALEKNTLLHIVTQANSLDKCKSSIRPECYLRGLTVFFFLKIKLLIFNFNSRKKEKHKFEAIRRHMQSAY